MHPASQRAFCSILAAPKVKWNMVVTTARDKLVKIEANRRNLAEPAAHTENPTLAEGAIGGKLGAQEWAEASILDACAKDRDVGMSDGWW